MKDSKRNLDSQFSHVSKGYVQISIIMPLEIAFIISCQAIKEKVTGNKTVLNLIIAGLESQRGFRGGK